MDSGKRRLLAFVVQELKDAGLTRNGKPVSGCFETSGVAAGSSPSRAERIGPLAIYPACEAGSPMRSYLLCEPSC